MIRIIICGLIEAKANATVFTFAAAAYNLVRMRNLAIQPT